MAVAVAGVIAADAVPRVTLRFSAITDPAWLVTRF
jgi:hypothetical protein